MLNLVPPFSQKVDTTGETFNPFEVIFCDDQAWVPSTSDPTGTNLLQATDHLVWSYDRRLGTSLMAWSSPWDKLKFFLVRPWLHSFPHSFLYALWCHFPKMVASSGSLTICHMITQAGQPPEEVCLVPNTILYVVKIVSSKLHMKNFVININWMTENIHSYRVNLRCYQSTLWIWTRTAFQITEETTHNTQWLLGWYAMFYC